MEQAGLRITVSADVREAILNLSNLTDATGELAVEGVGNITAINQALTELRAAKADVGNVQDLGTLNRAIKDLSAESARLGKAGTAGFDELGNKLKAVEPAAEGAGNAVVNAANGIFGAVRKIAFIVPGIGVAGIFGLVGGALAEAGRSLGLFGNGLSDANKDVKRLEESAKDLKKMLDGLKDAEDVTLSATGAEAGNIARVQALAAAVRDSNLTYAERKRALDELKETNKAYFGDLTLEANSLAKLTERVNKYSQALITEAIIKAQVSEIAKVSSALEEQVRVLDKLRDARDRAISDQKNTSIVSTGGGTGTVGGGNISQEATLATAVSRTTAAYEKQREAVLDLRTDIATKKGELNKNILAQLDEDPLKTEKTKKAADDLKSVIPILEEIKRIYDDLGKANKEPLFKLNKDSGANLPEGQFSPAVQVIQAQIAEAVKKAGETTSPVLEDAYKKLGVALNAKLNATLNPALTAHIRFDLSDVSKAEQITGIESKIEKAFGAKGLEIKIPANLSAIIENDGLFSADDSRKIADRLKRDPGLEKFYVNASVDVKAALGKFEINQADLEKLKKTIDQTYGRVITSGFVNIGAALGDVLSGTKNPLQRAIAGFTETLGDGLIKIGETMILASAAVATIQKALKGLFGEPVGGILAGVAAVAAGELVKNVGAHAFATGGIVTGPTLGLVGEAGPEVIFPLDRLNQFVKNTAGNGQQNINVTGVIRGRDLALVQARDSKLQNLTS